jgi:hypothetical protein
VAPLAVLAAGLTPAVARADVSSWLYTGAGPSWVDDGRGSTDPQLSLQIDTGLGSPPSEPVIVGGLARFMPHFGRGTDLGLLLRIATGGYQRGNWGGALDLGGYQRFWGVGSTGFMGTLSLGAPFGVTLDVLAAAGTNEAKSFGGTLGIDFARLTIYRESGLNWWTNPFPAVKETR